MLLLEYRTKQDLRECVGQALLYSETCTPLFKPEFVRNGVVYGSYYPHENNFANPQPREFCAKITMEAGKIAKVN